MTGALPVLYTAAWHTVMFHGQGRVAQAEQLKLAVFASNLPLHLGPALRNLGLNFLTYKMRSSPLLHKVVRKSQSVNVLTGLK